jgi:hypothetical protein
MRPLWPPRQKASHGSEPSRGPARQDSQEARDAALAGPPSQDNRRICSPRASANGFVQLREGACIPYLRA